MRIIAAGGVYVNGNRITDTQQLISPDEHVLPNNLTLLRIGLFLPHAIRVHSAVYSEETCLSVHVCLLVPLMYGTEMSEPVVRALIG